jgi:hypothetical protein
MLSVVAWVDDVDGGTLCGRVRKQMAATPLLALRLAGEGALALKAERVEKWTPP